MNEADMEDPYCTLSDVHSETRNIKPELTEKYLKCIELASRMVEDHCRRDFKYHEFSGAGSFYRVPQGCVMGDEVFLPFPAIELTGVWVTRPGESPSSSTLRSAGSYYTNSTTGNGITRIKTTSGEDFGAYPFRDFFHVQGRFGYAKGVGDIVSPDLPTSVRKATAIIAAVFSLERRLEQTNLEGNRIELIELNLPAEVFKYLNRFRHYSFML